MAYKCDACGAECIVDEERDYLYEGFGLPLTLQGIEVIRCPECNTESPIIPDMNDMMECVAMGILRDDRTLTGDEVRFLRKYVGLSAKEFAQKIGLDHTSLSKYENGKLKVSRVQDKLIRLMVVLMSDDKLLAEVRSTVVAHLNRGKSVPSIQRKMLIDAETMEFRYAV